MNTELKEEMEEQAKDHDIMAADAQRKLHLATNAIKGHQLEIDSNTKTAIAIRGYIKSQSL